MLVEPTSRVLRLALGLSLCLNLVFSNFQPVMASSVCHVKAGATGAQDGSSWASAFTDLQSALADPGCTEIWVAAGTYKPTQGTDRTISFAMGDLAGVALYGGFAGNETSLEQRNPAANPTILSGEIGAAGMADNSYHVVVVTFSIPSVLVDGFTITAGNADGNYEFYGAGGGMLVNDSTPVINNVIFSGNSAISGGGISNLFWSAPQLTNVVFHQNSAQTAGGGIINNLYSTSILTNVTFTGNTADLGAGMFNFRFTDPGLQDVTFEGNQAASKGGGMYNSGASPTLDSVTFVGNSAVYGGGMHSDQGGGEFGSQSHPVLNNVTFHNNSATYGGALSNNSESQPTLAHATFNGNQAGAGGAIYNDLNSQAVVTNSILYGDSGGEVANNPGSTTTITNSIVQGGYAGTGNLDVDPLLGPLQNNGGYTFSMYPGPGSLAVDAAGDPGCLPTDQRGVSRPQGPRCDMGSVEVEKLAGFIGPLIVKSIAGQDGWILESGENTGTGGSKYVALTTLRLGDSPTNRQYRAILSFDTSSLPEGAVITGVTLKIKKEGLAGTDPFTTHGYLKVDIRQGAFSDDPALQLADFKAAASRNEAAVFGKFPSDGWYMASFTDSAFAWIKLDGLTQLRLRFGRDDNNDFGSDIVRFYSGEASPDYAPQLIIEYDLP